MKKSAIYFCSFLVVFALFTFCYYSGYKRSLKELNRRSVEQKPTDAVAGGSGAGTSLSFLEDLSQKEKEQETIITGVNEATDPAKNDVQSIPAGSQQRKTILPTVEYYEETYLVPEDLLTKKQTIAPGFLIGMTREELESYVARYMEHLPLSEYEAGLLSYEIISFSENKVVLRKSYDSNKVPYKFYVNISDGMVTVYYSDLKTVYEYTHIPAVDLPEELRYSLIDGIYLKDAEELYSFLEGFSS